MADGETHWTPCWRCGQPIDYEFTRRHPRHRLAGTAHHIIGLQQGGDPLDTSNLTPAHRGCNTIMSNQLRGLARVRARPVVPTSSRRW